MSGTLILKNGLLAAACVAGLTLTACASSGQSSSSRYGDVYEYESGGSGCNANARDCGLVAQPYTAPQTVYSGQNAYSNQTIGGQAVSPGVVYADCSTVGGMNCNQQQVYTPPAYTPPVNTGPMTCPSGTTPAGDGTCMQSGGSYDYSSTTTATTSYTGPSYSGETADCPAGTTATGDGTCMESGGSSYDFSSTINSSTSYTGSTYSGEAADCPAGTTATGNGTCMESTGNVEIYDNTGYTPPSTYTPPVDYLPIRK